MCLLAQILGTVISNFQKVSDYTDYTDAHSDGNSTRLTEILVILPGIYQDNFCLYFLQIIITVFDI